MTPPTTERIILANFPYNLSKAQNVILTMLNSSLWYRDAYIGLKIWNLLPPEIKNFEISEIFRKNVTKQKLDRCPCRLCKTCRLALSELSIFIEMVSSSYVIFNIQTHSGASFGGSSYRINILFYFEFQLFICLQNIKKQFFAGKSTQMEISDTYVDIGHIALIFGSNFFNILLPAPPTFRKFKRLFDIGLIDGENGPKKLWKHISTLFVLMVSDR